MFASSAGWRLSGLGGVAHPRAARGSLPRARWAPRPGPAGGSPGRSARGAGAGQGRAAVRETWRQRRATARRAGKGRVGVTAAGCGHPRAAAPAQQRARRLCLPRRQPRHLCCAALLPVAVASKHGKLPRRGSCVIPSRRVLGMLVKTGNRKGNRREIGEEEDRKVRTCFFSSLPFNATLILFSSFFYHFSPPLNFASFQGVRFSSSSYFSP